MCNQQQALSDALSIELTAGNGTFLINDDCILAMSCLPDKSVDMVCVDLPYGTTANKWDIIIPFDKLWEQFDRVAKENAAMVFTAAQPFTSKLIMSNIDNFKYDIIWEKNNPKGFLNSKKRPLISHESICIFWNNPATYNPQMTVGKPYIATKGKKTANYGNYHPTTTINTGTRYPKTVLKINNPQYKNGHPTQKPVELMEYLVKTYSNPGDVILDCCMGSGTTGVACKNLNRNFIGIELDTVYFNAAKARIEEEK